MAIQVTISLPQYPRGFHKIGQIIKAELAKKKLPEIAICHIFIRHTSAALAINEGADPAVLDDLEKIFNRLVPENQPYYTHTQEGPDDMPSHAKAIMCGSSITIPITRGKMNLGRWQDIYLCEFRNHASGRELVVTVVG